jgi:hypothetical protein
MSLKLEIQLEKDAYAPGEEVQGVINVLEGDTARYVEVSISQIEVTSDYTDVVRSLPLGTVHTGDLHAGMSIPFSGPLPPDAEPNIVGPGSIIWRALVDVDRRGFDKAVAAPISIASAPPAQPLPPPLGGGPITAGGVADGRSRAPKFIALTVLFLVLAAATFFAVRKLLTYDDAQLPAAATLNSELEQRFGDASWFFHITSVEGDDPDPGDLSVDTNLSKAEGEPIVDDMCRGLTEYLSSKDIEGTTIFIHSTEDSFVKGQVILGTDWTCEEGQVDDF